jgi:hypothetical protein
MFCGGWLELDPVDCTDSIVVPASEGRRLLATARAPEVHQRAGSFEATRASRRASA